MAHDISREHLIGISTAHKRRIKDSLLLILIFIIGLAGSCYILHIALSQPSGTGHHHNPDKVYGESTEVIYFTGR